MEPAAEVNSWIFAELLVVCWGFRWDVFGLDGRRYVLSWNTPNLLLSLEIRYHERMAFSD